MAKKGGKKDSKGKKEKKENYKLGKQYDGGKLKGKFCPKCGPGVFMGKHKDRNVCGKCGYMEKV